MYSQTRLFEAGALFADLIENRAVKPQRGLTVLATIKQNPHTPSRAALAVYLPLP